MNKSNLFLFSMISLSIFSCSAMEKNNQLTTYSPAQGVINYIPVLSQLNKGIPAATIIYDIATGVVKGLEATRQGYNHIATHPTTTTIATGAQAGATTLATNAYSAGVTLCTATHNLYQWAYTERSINKEVQPTFEQALSAVNNNMNVLINNKNPEQCKNDIIENLKIIKQDISLITALINQAKDSTDNNPSGIRTTIIDHVLEKVKSENSITEKEAQDYTAIINEIASFSKTNDGQNNLEASYLETTISNEKDLLSELQEVVNPTISNQAFSAFINTYMENDTNLQTVLNNKKSQSPKRKLSDTTQEQNVQLQLPSIEELQQKIAALELNNIEITQSNEKVLATYKIEAEKLINDIQEHKNTITQLTVDKATLEQDKQKLTTTTTEQQQAVAREQTLKTNLEQEKTALKATIARLYSYIKIGSGVVTVSAIALLMYYFKLHEQCMALLK